MTKYTCLDCNRSEHYPGPRGSRQGGTLSCHKCGGIMYPQQGPEVARERLAAAAPALLAALIYCLPRASKFNLSDNAELVKAQAAIDKALGS